MRLAAALLLALLAATASAHDLITAETAQAYLARQAQLRKVIDAPGATSSRARAWLELGNMLDEIGALFNGDIDAHGKVQGLPSNVLMAELRARGDALAWSAARKRFAANLAHYREALRLDPEADVAAEASFRLLRGGFEDSFVVDPLERPGPSPSLLAEQIRLGETYLRRHPGHAGREEAAFMLAVHYIQAAVAADARDRPAWLEKARRLAADYTAAHPDDLRTVTLAALLERTSTD
jgi:hypothetical protein